MAPDLIQSKDNQDRMGVTNVVDFDVEAKQGRLEMKQCSLPENRGPKIFVDSVDS